MKKRKELREADTYILTHGKCGCDVPYDQISDISETVKKRYHQSAPEFWMWKMFQFGYAYGKREERARRKREVQTFKTNKANGNRTESEAERLRRYIFEMVPKIRSERRLRQIYTVTRNLFTNDGLEALNECQD